MNTILIALSFTLGWLAGTVGASSVCYVLPLAAAFLYLLHYAGNYRITCPTPRRIVRTKSGHAIIYS